MGNIHLKEPLPQDIEGLRKRVFELEKELRDSRAAAEFERKRVLSLLEDLPMFAYLQAPDYKVRYANRYFREIYGDPKDSPCHEVIWGRARPCENCPTFRVFETGRPEVWESAHSDGRTYKVHDIPFVDSDGSPLVLEISLDRTEVMRMEKEKQMMEAQLLQTQKLEAIGTLAAGVAHDFNNIITVVKSLNSLMIGKLPEGDQLLKYLEPVRNSCDRAISLVQQLLLFSRNRPFNLSVLNPNEVISDLMAMLEHIISEDINMETDLRYDLWKVSADRGRLEQALVNLVVNSSEAMPFGGKLVIRTENISVIEDQGMMMPGACPGQFVCITVEDTGVGIEKDALPRIFEPFFTTKSTKNTGMGLAVVYGIVKEHKGWVNASSRPGEGTVFKIYLPAAEETERVLAQECKSRIRRMGAGRRVLLVEDDKWVRKSTAMILSESGYAVFEASNAENAISLFYREKGRFDIVISDVVMPGRSGLQMISPLFDINPKVPILLCSGHLDDKSQFGQIVKRGIAYIQKPYEIEEFLQAVEETIDQGREPGA